MNLWPLFYISIIVAVCFYKWIDYKENEIIKELTNEIIDYRKVLDFYADPFDRHNEKNNEIKIPDFYKDLNFGFKAEEVLNKYENS